MWPKRMALVLVRRLVTFMMTLAGGGSRQTAIAAWTAKDTPAKDAHS